MTARRALAAGALWLCACALPQSPIPAPDGTLYDRTRAAMQYRSPLPRDLPPDRRTLRRASAESCRTVLAFPPLPPAVFVGSNLAAQALPWSSLVISGGDESYRTAIARMRADAGDAPLVDVHADIHMTAVLGIWTRECVEVHALVAQ
jgi:hypothetical protein